MQEIIEKYKKVRAFLGPRENWTKGKAYRLKSNGESFDGDVNVLQRLFAKGELACCFVGALAMHDVPNAQWGYLRVTAATLYGNGSLIAINDTEGHDAVLRVLDTTITQLENAK